MAGNVLTAFNAQVWSKRVLTRLDRVNVMLRCGAVNKDYEGEIKSYGDTVQVRTFGNVTMKPYRRGLGITYENLQPALQPLTINDSAYFYFGVDDLDTAQNDISALDGYTDRGAVAMNELIDNKTLSYYASAPTANQITNGGNAIVIAANNAYTTLVAAGTALDRQNVPAAGRWAVVGPNYKSFLIQDTTFVIRATDLGDSVVQLGKLSGPANKLPGYIGQCAGFNLFMSNGLPSDANGTYCQFGGPGCISYAGQVRKLERIRLQDTFADAVRGLILHDGIVFDEHAKSFGYIYVTVN